MKVKVIGVRKDYIDLLLDYLHNKHDGDCLNSNWTCLIFMIKICVTLNEVYGQYILTHDAFSCLRQSPCHVWSDKFISSEESLARDTHAHGLSLHYIFETKTLKTKIRFFKSPSKTSLPSDSWERRSWFPSKNNVKNFLYPVYSIFCCQRWLRCEWNQTLVGSVLWTVYLLYAQLKNKS